MTLNPAGSSPLAMKLGPHSMMEIRASPGAEFHGNEGACGVERASFTIICHRAPGTISFVRGTNMSIHASPMFERRIIIRYQCDWATVKVSGTWSNSGKAPVCSGSSEDSVVDVSRGQNIVKLAGSLGLGAPMAEAFC